MGSILLVDDDAASLRYMETVLNRMGHRCRRASNGVEALLCLEERMSDLVVSDVQMPEMDGLELLARVGERWPDLPVLLISVKDDVELVVRGVQAGAANYLLKPCPPQRVRDVVEKALKERKPRHAHGSFEIPEIIGRSRAMVQVRHSVALAARGDVSVLLCGETGAGKEVVARAIHRHSNQRRGSLIAHNCSTAPRDLFESIFFGHRKGAFTGADSDQKGLLQQANGGILFLDELEAMSPEQQAKLLRVLDDGEMRTVGETKAVHVDVRFIAATNCAPQELMGQERLREDLYYRLRGFEIVLPPLRARGNDVGLLALHFLGDRGSLSSEALEALAAYEWPGNVRELKNAIESARIRAGGGRIDPHHLQLGAIEWSVEGIRQHTGVMPAKSLRETERDVIQRTLTACGGNQSRAARDSAYRMRR